MNRLDFYGESLRQLAPLPRVRRLRILEILRPVWRANPNMTEEQVLRALRRAISQTEPN